MAAKELLSILSVVSSTKELYSAIVELYYMESYVHL